MKRKTTSRDNESVVFDYDSITKARQYPKHITEANKVQSENYCKNNVRECWHNANINGV